MDLKVTRQFVERAIPFEGLDGHFGLEGSAVFLALLFHYTVTGYIMVSYQSPSKYPVQFLGSTINRDLRFPSLERKRDDFELSVRLAELIRERRCVFAPAS